MYRFRQYFLFLHVMVSKKTEVMAVEKILSRIGLGLLLLLIISIGVCFYIGQFNYAYSLMILLLFVFGGMGAIYKLKNDEYMYDGPGSGRSAREEYEQYTR